MVLIMVYYTKIQGILYTQACSHLGFSISKKNNLHTTKPRIDNKNCNARSGLAAAPNRASKCAATNGIRISASGFGRKDPSFQAFFFPGKEARSTV